LARKAISHGIDINPDCKKHEQEGIEIFIGSQDDRSLLKTILQKYGRPDIVIDDGSHRMDHMSATFEFLYPHTAPHGVYLIEDTHTCYWPEYGGGLNKAGTFLERCKPLIDHLNAVHTRGALPVSDFTRSTDAICFYDSVVVFERRPQGTRHSPITVAMPLDGQKKT